MMVEIKTAIRPLLVPPPDHLFLLQGCCSRPLVSVEVFSLAGSFLGATAVGLVIMYLAAKLKPPPMPRCDEVAMYKALHTAWSRRDGLMSVL